MRWVMNVLASCCLVGCVLPLLALEDREGGVRLLHGVVFYTLEESMPKAEALAVAADGRILALGSLAELAARFPQAEREALAGAAALPGLIDAHAHLLGLGLALANVDLSGATSPEEVVRRLKEAERDLPPGRWLVGRGWDQTRWDPPVFPDRALLDRHFPERPVWLERVDGHAVWANAAALAHARRDLAGEWQPEGGRILRDERGEPTGVLIDAAMALVQVPPPDAAMRREALRRAVREAARAGLTGVHDAGMDRETLMNLADLADRGELPIRIYAMADGDGPTLDWLCREGPYEHPSGRLRMRAVKLYADGALGSRGAALLADYADEPGHRGLLVMAPERLRTALAKARDCGIQPAVHAIGDRANRIVLDLYEETFDPEQRARMRPRVEHAQVVAPIDLPRFAALGVIASMQPIHAVSDMRWAGLRLGPGRLRGAYAWKSLAESGAVLAFGSDFPVEPVSPLLGLRAALTRQDERGAPEGGWLAEERLDPVAALRAFTRGAAYAAFAEDELGSFAPGKRADFVLLDRDPFALAAGEWGSLSVLGTWLDGRRVSPSFR
ncbi:MAG: amidohydrolase [Lysobacterales bacterium]|nr:MAG: amidohydrolase [Xanthomonadales bacterium]